MKDALPESFGSRRHSFPDALLIRTYLLGLAVAGRLYLPTFLTGSGVFAAFYLRASHFGPPAQICDLVLPLLTDLAACQTRQHQPPPTEEQCH